MNNLRRRLETNVLQKFGNDKRQAIHYLCKQATHYARKADSKFGTPYYQQWRNVYKAYSTAAYNLQYWLEQDETIEEPLLKG